MKPETRSHPASARGLDLLPGDWVEVLPVEEILATLDEKGRLDALPFMPEMLEFCGRRFRVHRRADKTCDRVAKSGLRRMTGTVHLDDLRCDGESHGGCQARCLLFWKESWLRKVAPEEARPGETSRAQPLIPRPAAAVTVETLTRNTRADVVPEPRRGSPEESSSGDDPALESHWGTQLASEPPSQTGSGRSLESRDGRDAATDSVPEDAGEIRYSCQATAMLEATTAFPWWDLGHFVRDVRTGNASARQVLRWGVTWTLNRIQRVRGTYRLVETLRGSFRVPRIKGSLKKTPAARLDLKPGESVRVKSLDEIRATLDEKARNRGLSFDVEMVKYCGGTYRVLQRVEKIIDEPSGRMVSLPNDCIMLDKVVCTADYHGFCPRAIYPFWREIWLERVGRDD